MAALIQFLGLLPVFYKQYLAWQQAEDSRDYAQYVDDREHVIAELKGAAGDPKKYFEAAMGIQSMLRSGRLP